MNHPTKKYDDRAKAINSLLCIGLDSAIGKLPAHLRASATPQFDFNRAIIEATNEMVAAYKFNSAFYEARGEQGMRELKLSMDYLRERHPDILTIDDAKRGDIGNTNMGYVTAIFDELGFDAVTLNPYMGQEVLQPFLIREDKCSMILVKTSNPGSGEFQDLKVPSGKLLWQEVAEHVRDEWNSRDNCMLVIGSTYPAEVKQLREIAPDMTFLVPGSGAQGGGIQALIKNGCDANSRGLIINSSRGIIFASSGEDFAEAAAREAKALRDEINSYR